MPTVHPCGCVCPCDPDKGRLAMTALMKCKAAVEEADQALKNIRNSGASEEDVQAVVAQRDAAEQALGAAYKNLVDQAAHPKAELDDEEAVATDGSDEATDEDVSMDVGNSSAMSFGDDDEDDEDYIPPAH